MIQHCTLAALARGATFIRSFIHVHVYSAKIMATPVHGFYVIYNPEGPGLQRPSAVRTLLWVRGIIKNVEFIEREV